MRSSNEVNGLIGRGLREGLPSIDWCRNDYDKNAVSVFAKQEGAKLGHLPKESAKIYADLLDSRR